MRKKQLELDKYAVQLEGSSFPNTSYQKGSLLVKSFQQHLLRRQKVGNNKKYKVFDL